MARARATVDLFQQFSADYEARRPADPHATATPLTGTVTETQPVTVQSASRIGREVEQVPRRGESTLPASLVRYVAADPGSTWHRLLTDPSRGGVELSTQSYRPTGPIWREVVATQATCFAPTCSRAAARPAQLSALVG